MVKDFKNEIKEVKKNIFQLLSKVLIYVSLLSSRKYAKDKNLFVLSTFLQSVHMVKQCRARI